jgi:hypothetical protein
MYDNLKVLQDLDLFFYYGQNDLEIETKSDVLANIMQPKRSLFYNRALDSSGVQDYENMPAGLTLRINLPYDIVNSLSKRNQFVSNGENGSKDRRIALSQATIRTEIDSKLGNVNVTILYIPLADFKQTQNLQFNLGIGN